MIQAREEGIPFLITGTDWPTRDGSGLRDYVHVWDLAAAHVAALTRFDALPGPTTVINLGTGTGTTVRELLDAFNRVAEPPIEAHGAERRPGDTVGAYTRIDRAERLLNWRPQYDILEGVRHSLQWAAVRDDVLSGEAALCEAALCEAGQREAGQREAGQREAGQREAGQREAGQREAGQREAGQREAGQGLSPPER
jgi:hypothetical protein